MNLRNNLLVVCCSAVGIIGGLIYHNATAYEMQVVTGEHEIVTMTEKSMTAKGKWKVVAKQRMIAEDCAEHSYAMATQWRVVECKSDPVKVKKQPSGRWSRERGVSFP